MFKSKTRGLMKTAVAMTVAAVMLSQAVFAAETYESREDIPAEYKWDLTDVYAAPEDVEADFKLLEEKYIPGYEQFRGKLNDKENILAGLNHMAETLQIINKLYVYAMLGLDWDMSGSEAQELLNRVELLNQKDSEAAAFFFPELAQADESMLRSCMADPDFEVYANDLERILAEKEHTPSEEENALLAKMQMFSMSPGDTYSMFNNVDITFDPVTDSEGNEHEVTQGSYGVLMESPDRELRRAAYDSLFGAYMEFNNTLAANLSAEVTKNIFYAEAYNYDSALESLLTFGVPVSVYENLTETAGKEVSGLHKYFALRKAAMKLDTLYPYDGYVPLTAGDKAEYSFEEAKEMVLAALQPLGDEYVAALKKGFEENWVDVYETPGKSTGAYCMSVYGSHPFVLMNYNGTLNDAATLAHEMGHAMHSYYSNAGQPFDDADTDIFTAEVASTLNEMLFYRYLIDGAETNAEKLDYTMALVELYVSSFYAQTMYAEFEQYIHETAEAGGALTADVLNEKWLGLAAEYYGESYTTTELTQAGWSRIPHFYYGFYVYQYATSMAATNQIAAGIIDGEPEARGNYLEFLSSGCKYNPIETLSKAGADMTSPAVTEECAKEFGLIVDEMEKLMQAEGLV